MKGNSKSFKIVSKFYVIYGDGIPIYVGYTNRTVKQRFKEHKSDKDFSEYNSVKSIELKDQRMSFDFTWDYSKTCGNANEVSEREEYLVKKYHTQNTCYQKAVGGGQTWAFEKWFVKVNKDNPRFDGMSGAEIKARIEKEKVISADICNFVNNMKTQYKLDMGDFIRNIGSQYKVDISDFVAHMKYNYRVDISTFINNIKPKYQIDIDHFVSTMERCYKVDISGFVKNIKMQYQVDIGNFVNGIKIHYQVDISGFVKNMKIQYQVDIGNFTCHIKIKEKINE